MRVECAVKGCHGALTLVESESGIVWGGVCQDCGRHNEKCQKCGAFFVQMWRHLAVPRPWDLKDEKGNLKPEPDDRKKKRARAQACRDGNPTWRAHRAAKGMRQP